MLNNRPIVAFLVVTLIAEGTDENEAVNGLISLVENGLAE